MDSALVAWKHIIPNMFEVLMERMTIEVDSHFCMNAYACQPI